MLNNRKIIKVDFPKLQINGVAKNIIEKTSHIKHIYWFALVAVFLTLFITLMPHDIYKDFWYSIKAQWQIVTLMLVFALVAVSLMWSIGQKIDILVFLFLNMRGTRAPWLDWTMLVFTQLGSGIFAGIVALILYITGNNLAAYELTFGVLTLWLIVEFAKIVIKRARPYLNLKDIRIIGSRSRGHSFPSGHTSQAFFMVTLLMHYFNLNVWIWIGLYGVSLLIGVTRIYVGMHYPRDVLGGAMLGTAWGLLGVIINCYIWNFC